MFGRRASYLLILPAAAIYCGLFVAAAFYFFVLSFWSVKSFRVVPDFTLKNYAKTFTTHLGSGEMTLLIAFAIALARPCLASTMPGSSASALGAGRRHCSSSRSSRCSAGI